MFTFYFCTYSQLFTGTLTIADQREGREKEIKRVENYLPQRRHLPKVGKTSVFRCKDKENCEEFRLQSQGHTLWETHKNRVKIIENEGVRCN